MRRVRVIAAIVAVCLAWGTAAVAVEQTDEQKKADRERILKSTNEDRLTSEAEFARAHGDIIVSPNGPKDGGDFGPNTPGTRTSGLQEAFDACKKTGKDLYIVGGNWTLRKTKGVCYRMTETLRIPPMQNFRCDGGHYVLWYLPKEGDAIDMDSQMSCHYRMGILKSDARGATLRIHPHTVGPDNFTVVTTTEFNINAIVGGGGAWPGGEHFSTELNPKHEWVGAGLMLDGSEGPIDGNWFRVIEVVGCARAIYLTGSVTDNWIDSPMVHLSRTGLQIGDPGDKGQVFYNRINAYVHAQGIADAVGATVYGADNLLTLSCGQTSPGHDLVLEKEARGNLIFGVRMYNGITNRAALPTNRVIMTQAPEWKLGTPEVPASGQTLVNREPFTVEASILTPGVVTKWRITDVQGTKREFASGFFAGQSILLQPGDVIGMEYTQPPTWLWRKLP